MSLSLRLLLLAVPVLVVGCSKYDGKIIIADVTKSTQVTLRAAKPSGTVVGISIRGRGRLDGTGQIVLILNGRPYRTEELDGNIRFDWTGDWYSPLAEVRYEPRDANGGQIELRYRFR